MMFGTESKLFSEMSRSVRDDICHREAYSVDGFVELDSTYYLEMNLLSEMSRSVREDICGGLVVKAHGLLRHSTRTSSVIKKEKKIRKSANDQPPDEIGHRVEFVQRDIEVC